MRELALQIPDELFVTLQQTAHSFQEIEIYTNEQIEQWIQADQLSTEERKFILQKVGVSLD
jgi:hypothetical protein